MTDLHDEEVGKRVDLLRVGQSEQVSEQSGNHHAERQKIAQVHAFSNKATNNQNSIKHFK